MAICPAGHDSEWDDYCSLCGAAMAPELAPSLPDPPTIVPRCSNCEEAHGPDDVFCENCGYDFIAGTLPDVEQPAVVPEEPAATAQWQATITVDLEFFVRMAFDGVDPPATVPEPVKIDLPPTDILIGRHSASRGIFPEIDLVSLFDESVRDVGVSSRHAKLHFDGARWTVTDLGSTNGTYAGAAPEALPEGVATPVEPNTPIFVGAWTRIELSKL